MTKTPGRSKYGAIPTTVDNVRFASKREARRYEDLKLLQKAGKITELTLQPRFDLIVNGVKICTYVADFRYFIPGRDNPNPVIEDAKGMKTRDYKLKKKLMLACHGIEIQEV